MEHLYPVCLYLKDLHCLVVGGGFMAVEKIPPLVEAEANVKVVTEKPSKKILSWAEEGKITLHQRTFTEEDITETFLVLATDGDTEINSEVYRLANKHNKPVCAVDDIPRCNFIAPAIAREGYVSASISTSGCSPALATKLKNQIKEEIITPEVGRIASYFKQWRPQVKESIKEFNDRKLFWQEALESAPAEYAGKGDYKKADEEMQLLICAINERKKEESDG